MFLAVLLDKNIRGTRFYQSALYLPVVLSLAIVGFIWELEYAPDEGFINNVLGTTRAGQPHRLAGEPRHQPVGGPRRGELAPRRLHDGPLPGRPEERRSRACEEAAPIDGANERQTFFRVVFPVLRPINIVVLVITVIESLRAFDIVYIINRGLNGLELLSVLVTNNIIGEAVAVGFGSAIAVVLLVISLGPILVFLARTPCGRRVTSIADERVVTATRQRRGIRWRRVALHVFLIADQPSSGCSRIAVGDLHVVPAVRGHRGERLRRRCPGRLTLDNYVNAWNQARAVDVTS